MSQWALIDCFVAFLFVQTRLLSGYDAFCQQINCIAFMRSLWRNRLARSAVNRKVGGSSPPRDVSFRFWALWGPQSAANLISRS